MNFENIKLFNDDCFNVFQEIKENSIDFILTDPPYGTSACKWDSIIPLKPMWIELQRIIKENKPIILFGSEPFSSYLRTSNIDWFKYDWIWEKQKGSNFLNYKYQPSKNYEIISVFSKGATSFVKNNINCPYNPQMVEGTPYKIKQGKGGDAVVREGSRTGKNIITKNNGTRYPNAIQKFNSDKEKLHPTQKPIALLEYFIKTYTKENDIVLDFTMGSGSTGVACKNVNRRFIGIEKDKKYFKIAKERIDYAFI
jgi:site-specific DNA-methyltransferase (adenine-specific)|tara:strand:+ start:183 stop:944 length:762 start_codon:yes stop_codon:yes gene_type:complete